VDPDARPSACGRPRAPRGAAAHRRARGRAGAEGAGWSGRGGVAAAAARARAVGAPAAPGPATRGDRARLLRWLHAGRARRAARPAARHHQESNVHRARAAARAARRNRTGDLVDVHELTAAYALDALDGEERETYETHLAQCERCRAELGELSEVAGALAFGVSSPAPSPALRTRILDAAASERTNVRTLRRPWFARPATAIAAAAARVAVGLGTWAASLSNSLGTARSAQANVERAMAIYADPQSRRVALRGGAGTLAVDPTGQAALVVRRLAAAPAGGRPIRAGLFEGGDASTVVALAEPVPSGAVVAATIEHDGGVDAPTTQP